MTRAEIRNTAIAALVGAVAVFGWDYVTDRISRGTDAVAADQINDLIDKRLQMDSGKTVHQVLTDLDRRSLTHGQKLESQDEKLDIIIGAVSALSE